MTRSLFLLPFEELVVGLSSRALIEEAARREQSTDPHGNTCPKLAHLQNNSVWHPGQNLNLGSPTWLRALATVARASAETVTGKEIEMFWGVMAWRVTSVAMGSLSERAGVINIASRSYSQKTRTCPQKEWNQPGLWFGVIASKLIFNLNSFQGHHNWTCMNRALSPHLVQAGGTPLSSRELCQFTSERGYF